MAAVAVVVALWIAQPAPPASPTPSPSSGARSAVAACELPSSDPKAGGQLTWRLAVRADSPQQVDLLFVSGRTRLLCTAYRAPDGTFGSVVTSMGGSPDEAPASDVLTYETGGGPIQGGQYPTLLIVGRMPSGTARIEVATSDGDRRDATLGDGWYMAHVVVGNGSEATDIAAYDSAGRVISRLAGPNGVQPGATAGTS
jgi:hypothetical protein